MTDFTKHDIPAAGVKPDDVLLDSDGEPWPKWSNGKPHKVMKVELIARITFDDYRAMDYPASHMLDVSRDVDKDHSNG